MTTRRRARAWLAVALLIAGGAGVVGAGGRHLPRLFRTPNSEGVAATLNTGPAVTLQHPFFRSLGTNGRACVTCHAPTDGWSVVPAHVRARFEATRGLDPLFRPNDGSTSPHADVSTVAARRAAYALLLSKGLIRVGMPMPAGAEFELTDVDDPYGFASAEELSLFRRPLPSTNLTFLSTVMWDGRETFTGQSMHFNLANQANGATVGHAQGAPLSEAVRNAIVDFELGLFTVQIIDRDAGSLAAEDGPGGPQALAREPFWLGINSAQDPTGTPPTLRVFTLFDSWSSAVGRRSPARQAIARGQTVFNERRFGPRGSTCSSCHNAPNAGTSSTAALFDVGVSDEQFRTPDLPLYTFTCLATGAVVKTTDPGLGLRTGKCRDLGKFKVPGLRGLAARAPYFHNGSAATLADVVHFYDVRFAMGLTELEKEDLVAFLAAL